MKKSGLILIGIGLWAALLSGCTSVSGTEVTTVMAKSDRDMSSLSWHGTVEALKSIDVLPNGAGKVVEILVSEGGMVKAGDVLFRVDDTDAGLSLKQSEAGVHSAEVAFNSARTAKEENTSVTPAEISYANASANYGRIKTLYDSGAISKAEMENARSQMDVAKAQLKTSKNGQQSSYDSALAQLESARAALEIAKKKYTDCSVTSPVDGMVTSLAVEAGQTVSAQMQAVTVIDSSGEKISIQVPDMEIGGLSQDMPMEVYLQALGETSTGHISEISPTCDPKTGMFTVQVMLDGGNQNYIGLSADVKLSGEQKSPSVYIPGKCISVEGEQSSVFVVKDGIVKKQAVVTGKKKNAYMEVTEGLSKGEEVVMQSSVALEDGMNVRVITVK